MNLRQRSARYGWELRFVAGFAGMAIVAAAIISGIDSGIEWALAAALVVAILLHARLGFALSTRQAETEIVQKLVRQVEIAIGRENKSADQKENEIHRQDIVTLQRVKDALVEKRIDLYLQPIVSLPQRKPRFFEAYSRLRDVNGHVLLPSAYIEAAERANRIGVIDNMILMRCIQELRHRREADPRLVVFCNLSPATIFDPNFFNDLTDYLESNSDLANNLVFEFTHPAVEMMHPRVEENLKAIAARGFAFSIDHIQTLDLDWAGLREKNFRYAKASASLLLSESRGDERSSAKLAAFRAKLSRLGIDLIAEKIESENDMPEILALGLDYGEGNLFGAARNAAYYLGLGEKQPEKIARAS